MGGGGRGIRVAPTVGDLKPMFTQEFKETLTAFGYRQCFVKKYVEKSWHIKVHCLGDGTGSVIFIWDRVCSVQRWHQKIIEIALVSRRKMTILTFFDTLIAHFGISYL